MCVLYVPRPPDPHRASAICSRWYLDNEEILKKERNRPKKSANYFFFFVFLLPPPPSPTIMLFADSAPSSFTFFFSLNHHISKFLYSPSSKSLFPANFSMTIGSFKSCCCCCVYVCVCVNSLIYDMQMIAPPPNLSNLSQLNFFSLFTMTVWLTKKYFSLSLALEKKNRKTKKKRQSFFIHLSYTDIRI